jgi:aspartate/methionine/tyrosine aminotransferase
MYPDLKINAVLKEMAPNQIHNIFNRVKRLETNDINIINFAFDSPMLDIPKLIYDAAFEVLKHNRRIRPSFTGIPELKSEVCDYIDRTRMFRPKLNQILIGPGGNCLLFATLFSLLNKGDTIVVPDPGKPIFSRIPTLIGAKVKYLPLIVDKKIKIDLHTLDRNIEENTKAVILNTPQDPTGDVISNTELQEISEIVEKYDALLISDETFSQIIFENKHLSPAIFDRASEQTIIIEDIANQYSMSGWGLGFCVGPSGFIESIKTIMSEFFPPVPEFIQFAGAAAMDKNEDLKENLLKEYKKCRDIMVNGLNNIQGFSCIPPEGGAYVFLNISGTGMSSMEFAEQLLEKAGIVVLPGEVFGKSGKDHVRISFATNEERINEGLTRLEEMF